jgi:hypothetical protein
MLNFKKYKYDMIIIRLTNSNDYTNIQKYMHEQGILWSNGSIHILRFSNNSECMHLYVHLNDSGGNHYLIYSGGIDNNYISTYKHDPKIYTIEDFNKIKCIIENGVLLPNYKPKRIERSL